ncbi:MAG: hypothetical protein KDB53_10605 [Planctomycetes bacterium]|nr:hypothetical protein [Planctomycetota bacterium]
MTIAKTLKSLLLVCVLTLVARADIIFLRDGRMMHVKVLSADEKGIDVEMLDTGGRLFVRWDLLREDDRRRLRIEMGFDEDDSGADLLMMGLRVHVRKGTSYDGIEVEPETPDQDHLHLRSDGRTMTIRRDAIRRIEEREISKFEVYTPEELYQMELLRLNPGEDDAQAQFEMARWATKVGMYFEAIAHYLRVQQADPELKAAYVDNQIKRLEVLSKRKDILDAIVQAERNVGRNRFQRAVEIFDEVLAVADLPAEIRREAEKKKEKTLKKRWDYYVKEVSREYNRQVDLKIRAVASSRDIGSSDKEKAMTIDRAMSYVRSQLHKEVIETVAQKLELDPKGEVAKMWEERKKGARRSATYGSGTFVIAGVQEVGAGGGGGGQNQQIQDLLERVRGGGRRGGAQQPAQEAAPKLLTKEQWWAGASSVQRRYYLRAFFAENGKQYEVLRDYLRPCTTCGGTGSIKELGSQGGFVKRTCPRCQGNTGDRTINYR